MATLQNNNYIKCCKFFNRFPFFKRLGNIIKSEKLISISDYLNEEYNLLPNEVITTSIATFLIFYIPLVVIFSQINIIMGFIIPIILSYAVAYKIFNHPINNFNRIQLTLLQYSDLAFQDFLLILNTTNSIFDAIHFISEAKYPILSQKFKDMIFQINFNGKSPESLIGEFIKKLPKGNLKERLISLIATKFQPNKILKQLELLGGEKKYEYEIITRQLESKLIIIVGICLFFPILTALFISFLSYSANYLSFLMIFVFVIISHKLKNQILKAHFELFGESNFLDNVDTASSNSIFLEFLQFLTYFGNELILEIPQEIAVLKAFQSYNGMLKDSLEICVREIYYKNNSFKKGWDKLRTKINNPQIKFLIDLIERMLEKSSIETGNRLISIIQQIKNNQELIQERESIIKAQQFKIKFLTFIMAAILGLVAGLAPLLFQISKIINNPAAGVVFSFWDSIPLAISLFIMTIYSAYFLTKLVKIRRPGQFSFWTGLFFSFFWYLTSYFL